MPRIWERVRGVLSKEISVDRIFIFLFAAFIIVYVSLGLFVGFGLLGDWQTVALGCIFAYTMIVGIRLFRDRLTQPIFSILSFSILLYFMPRIAQYLVNNRDSLKNLYILFPQHWNSVYINMGLLFVVISTIFCVAGIWAGGWFGNRVLLKNRPIDDGLRKDTPIFSPYAIFFSALVIFVIEGYFTLYLGMNASANCVMHFVPGVWLIHFFNSDIWMLLVIVLLFARYEDLSPSMRFWIYAAMCLYILYMAAHGSRGGTVRVATACLGAWIALRERPTVTLRQAGFVGILFTIGALVAGLGGNFMRSYNRQACGANPTNEAPADSKKILLEVFRHHEVPDRFKDPKGDRNQIVDSNAVKVPAFIANIGDRLGMIDYPVGVATMAPNPEAQARYMNLDYMMKNLKNNLVVGEPYPEARYMTSSLMAMVYRGKNYQHVTENFQSDMWMAWGSAFALFGFWGAMPILFLVSFLLPVIQAVFVRVMPRSARSMVFASWAWLGTCGVVYFQMSIDHAAFFLISDTFKIAVCLGLVLGFDWFLVRIKQKLPKGQTVKQ